jgi:hydrogenase/urease accessory protein HupE
MSWMQIALLSTTLMIASGYFGGTKFSPKLMRNVTGGFGVLAGLAWQGALGLADGGLAYRLGFIIAGYATAMAVLRARGVES